MDLLEYWKMIMPQLLKAGVDGSGVVLGRGQVPPCFGRAVDTVRRLRSVRCFYLLAELLGTVQCSRDFLQHCGLNREVVAAERIPESMMELAMEQLKDEVCTFSNPYVRAPNTITSELVEIVEEVGWDEEFCRLVAELRTVLARFLSVTAALKAARSGGVESLDPRSIC